MIKNAYNDVICIIPARGGSKGLVSRNRHCHIHPNQQSRRVVTFLRWNGAENVISTRAIHDRIQRR